MRRWNKKEDEDMNRNQNAVQNPAPSPAQEERQRTAADRRDAPEPHNPLVDDFSFKIVRHVGVLSTSPRGWTREVNIVSWNAKPARLDIRDWAPDHEKMSRGVALNGHETDQLKVLLSAFIPQDCGI
jgi:hypothetical protein